MTEEHNPTSPSSTLSRFPHPSSIPRLPPTPIYTNTHPSLPYTPTASLPSSRFSTPIRIQKGPQQNLNNPQIDSQFQSIPEEVINYIDNNTNNNSQSLEQQLNSEEHKNIDQQQQPVLINNQCQSSSIPQLNSNDNNNNYIQNNNNDTNTYEQDTNNYTNNNVQNDIQLRQQQLFEQQQKMFDQNMFMMQQRIQQLEQQIVISQQESANLKYEQAYYNHQQQQPTWNTNNNNNNYNNNINSIIAKSISKPDNFDGNASLIDSWIHSIRNYVLLANIPLDKQVPIVGTYLRGNAQSWFVHLSINDKTKCLTLDGFFTSLIAFFRPVNLVQATRKQLNELQQRGFEIIKFNSRFNQLVQKLPIMDTQELLDKYREKLDYNIQLALVGKEFHELSSIQTAAVQADCALKQMTTQSNNKPRYNNYNNNNNNNNINTNNHYRPRQQSTAVVNNVNVPHEESNQPGSDNDEETNVQINYVNNSKRNNVNKPIIPKMTPEIHKWCMDNRACFRCRSIGHSSSNCTKFPSSTSGGTSLQPATKPSNQHF